MLFSLLFIAMMIILVVLVGVWFLRPDLRRWMEGPKYRMLEQEERFDSGRSAE